MHFKKGSVGHDLKTIAIEPLGQCSEQILKFRPQFSIFVTEQDFAYLVIDFCNSGFICLAEIIWSPNPCYVKCHVRFWQHEPGFLLMFLYKFLHYLWPCSWNFSYINLAKVTWSRNNRSGACMDICIIVVGRFWKPTLLFYNWPFIIVCPSVIEVYFFEEFCCAAKPPLCVNNLEVLGIFALCELPSSTRPKNALTALYSSTCMSFFIQTVWV